MKDLNAIYGVIILVIITFIIAMVTFYYVEGLK
jgi:flagellin-like protein